MEIVHRNIKLQTIKLWNHNILWSNACQEHTHGGSHTSSIGAKKTKEQCTQRELSVQCFN